MRYISKYSLIWRTLSDKLRIRKEKTFPSRIKKNAKDRNLMTELSGTWKR